MNDDNLSRADVSKELPSKRVDGSALARQDVAIVEPAYTERLYSEGVADADDRIVDEQRERVGSTQLIHELLNSSDGVVAHEFLHEKVRDDLSI